MNHDYGNMQSLRSPIYRTRAYSSGGDGVFARVFKKFEAAKEENQLYSSSPTKAAAKKTSKMGCHAFSKIKNKKAPKIPCGFLRGHATFEFDLNKRLDRGSRLNNEVVVTDFLLSKTGSSVNPLKFKSKQISDASSLPFLSRVGLGQRDPLYGDIFRQDGMATREIAHRARGTQSHGTVECDDWFDDRRIGSILSNELEVELIEGLSRFILVLRLEKQIPPINSLRISPLEQPNRVTQVF